jgi:dTMP kinase
VGQEALKNGRFITFEGGEGAGKSTQVGLLVDAMVRAGLSVVRTREPGGAPGAEDIRKLLVEGEPARWDAASEALLMVAARRCHLVDTVWPAMKQGKWVVCDRFADSTLAYQGYGGGVSLADLEALHRIIAGDFVPDLTLVLDLPVEVGLKRAAVRAGSETRFERKGHDFHERMRQGFLDIAKREPTRCVVVDARGEVDAVHHIVKAAVGGRFKLKL